MSDTEKIVQTITAMSYSIDALSKTIENIVETLQEIQKVCIILDKRLKELEDKNDHIA